MNLNTADTFNKELSPDTNLDNNRRKVFDAMYSYVVPKVPSAPELIHVSLEMAENLGLKNNEVNSDEFLRVFSGTEVYKKTEPYAMAYAGHQFGHFTMLGDGRAVKRTTPGSLVFTGNLKTDDVLKPVKLGSDGWNLIGNPYPSLLNVNTNANSSNNMVSVNFANLSAGFKALYFWDAVNGSYIPFNNASDAKYIAPGQGFFVKIDGNTSISFNENMQTHQLGDNFLKSQNTFNIKLKVNNGTSGKETDIKYINKMTLGIDEGYDARLFDDKTPFSISTFILDESDNHKYAIQVLPTYNYDSMVIPVSINTKSNTELVFTVEANNIPDGFNIYLEDRELNTFTKFNKSESSYKVNISNEMNGDKRFYLHTTSGVLSAENVTYDSSIRIYQNTQNTLKIEGLKKEDAKIKLISILGKEVFKEALKNTLNQEVKVSNISKGIYIVQISFASGKITKKIIFD